MFLTAPELHQLTGYVRPSKQREWLERNGIPHIVAMSGYPRVKAEDIGAAPAQHVDPAKPVHPPKPELLAMPEIASSRAPYTLGYGPVECGIYFLWDEAALLYIGLSNSIPFRLRAHFMKRIDDPPNAIWFSQASVVEVPEFWLRTIEADYILRERPPYNIRGCPKDNRD